MTPIYARIYKIDEATQMVHGRAAQETIDRSGEIFDYRSSVPFFRAWSANVFHESGGASYGNVRSMHGNVAAGKLTEIDFNDAERAIDVSAKIVDPVEWEKCKTGVFTGFSIGGTYAKKWTDVSSGQPVTRYTAVPSEISLVDRPCIPSARFFSMTKRDGTTERRAFKARESSPDLFKFIAQHRPTVNSIRQIHDQGAHVVPVLGISVDPKRLRKRHRQIGQQKVDLRELSRSLLAMKMRKTVSAVISMPPNSSNAFDTERTGSYGQTRNYSDDAIDVTHAPAPMDNRAKAAAVIAICLKRPAGTFGG
jgi:hypothetical protein